MSKGTLNILGTEIGRGKRAVLEMKISRLPTRNIVTVPVIIERAKKDGPIILLMAGVHGDETNGVAIIRDIIRKKYNKPSRGTIICIPVFNVFGYLDQSREFPDGRDLNRMFPGSPKGSLAGQFAFKFTKEIMPIPDYVIDFHTGGAERENFPNVRCVFQEEESFELSKAFGAPFIVHSKYIPKSIREGFKKKGKTTILFEGGKSLNLDQKVIDCGVEGALNVMKYLNIHEGEIEHQYETVIVTKSKWIRASHSGLFQALAKNGSKVKRRDIIGKISDPYGNFEKNVFAPFDCSIFGLNTGPIVYKGDAIFHISVETLDSDKA